MKILSILFALTFFTPAVQWSTDFEQAKTTAEHDKKPILLSFAGSDWCVPCIKMKKDVFESAAFTDYASKNLVLLRADFPRLKKNKLEAKLTTANKALAEKYNPQGKFPFTVLLDSKGTVLKSWDGLPKGDAAAFVAEVKAVKK